MSQSRRRRWAVLLAVAAIAAAIGGYTWWNRTAPKPPAVDLSRADPEVADAVNRALEAVAAHPRNAAAWGDLGTILRAHDFDAESVEVLRGAEQLDPADWRWPYLSGLTLVLSDPDSGRDCLRRAADRSPAERPEPRLRLAEVLFERGQLDEAETIARPLSTRERSAARASLVLAQIAAERGDWSAVLSLTVEHRDTAACRKRMAALRGNAHLRLGRPEQAVREWDRARELPEDASWPDPLVDSVVAKAVGTKARMRRAANLLAEGRAAEAVESLQEAVRSAPTNGDAQLLLGSALNQLGDYAAARQELRTLTARTPESVEGWFQLGVAEFQLGDAAAAAVSFARVVQLKPDHALAHFNLGHARKKLGDKPGAIAAFQEALRCRPDHEPSRAALRELEAKR